MPGAPTPPENTPATRPAHSATSSVAVTSPVLRGTARVPDPTEISEALSLTAAAEGQHVGLPTQVPTNTPAASTYAPTVIGGPNLAALDTVMEENGLTVGSGVAEFTTWEHAAEEDMAAALLRVAQLAEDEHKLDESVSVEERYSRYIAALLAKGPVKFNASFLQ